MKVRLLPSSAGEMSQRQALTTYLVNDCLAIDGGSIGFALAPEAMPAIRHIVVTHSHTDHMASLPVFIAEAYVSLDGPVFIYGMPEVIAALREFVFNDQIWPDFEKIKLMDGSGPTIEFRELTARETVEIAGLRITPVPVNHVVPTVGLVIHDGGSTVAFTSDTYVTDEFWQVARRAPDLRAVFVDVSFPNELDGLAAASKHLTPRLLAEELKKLDREAVDVLAVHIKPTNREQVIEQLEALGNARVRPAHVGVDYVW